MKMTRTYLQGCTWCNATGVKFPMQNTGTGFSSICPVCNGSKTVIVTEVTEEMEKEEMLSFCKIIDKDFVLNKKYYISKINEYLKAKAE